jgi:hypothetical protein
MCIAYHIVFIPKCRRKRLLQEIREHLDEVFYDLSFHCSPRSAVVVYPPLGIDCGNGTGKRCRPEQGASGDDVPALGASVVARLARVRATLDSPEVLRLRLPENTTVISWPLLGLCRRTEGVERGRVKETTDKCYSSTAYQAFNRDMALCVAQAGFND